MHCTQCGVLNEADAKFCAECGYQVSLSQSAQKQAINANEEIAATQQVDVGQVSNNMDYAQLGKNVASEFLGFAKKSIASPMKASREVSSEDKVSGIITHVLFALLLPLFSYFAAKGLSAGYIEVPFGAFVVRPFFFLLIYLAVYSAVVLGVSKLMKSQVNYIEVVVRFGVFNVLPVALLLLAVLFSILSVPVFSFILFGTGIGLFFVSCIAIIFSVKENGEGLDVFYGLILANIAMSIIFMIIGDSIVGNLINQVENMVPYGFY
ncbi:zinc ribbon domain-containing protein [Aquibacillus kalidii]|uniref:zinc ribbon domain-containing protein n=1 Tax=Aquibacillus kalidii TaxID=2762597 RepID=UPI001647A952|nr:zinc ribbon domain-containing protein [Aquibacillus kalidii]